MEFIQDPQIYWPWCFYSCYACTCLIKIGLSLLFGSKKKDLVRLQRLQNRAARIIFQVSRRHHTSPLLKSLHWLPIERRIQFKILLHVFKTLNDLSPVYLTDCITIYVPPREGLRSNSDSLTLIIPRSKRATGDGSFSVSGPSLWNQLPHAIRSLKLHDFKKTSKNAFILMCWYLVAVYYY